MSYESLFVLFGLFLAALTRGSWILVEKSEGIKLEGGLEKLKAGLVTITSVVLVGLTGRVDNE